MNSLTELNGYVTDLTLDYTDLRSPTVVFDSINPINQSQTVDEGFSFYSSVGIEITEIINSLSSQPTYAIDVRSLPGTTVAWASLPSGLSLNSSTIGLYIISGLSTVAHWNAIKQATITLPTNYYGLWTYTSTINYFSGIEGSQSKGWTTAVTVNDVQFLSTPLAFTYAISATSNITNTPQIANLDVNYPSATWTIVGTPSSNSSISTWTSTGSGGTFSVSGSKVFTITGTRAQVNSRLAGLQITSNAVNLDFVLTYVLSNNLNSSTDTKIQVMSNVGLIYLGSPAVAYFNEDATSTNVSGFAPITDNIYDGSGGYVYTVTPSTTSAIVSMTVSGTASFKSFNESTKVLTLNGTRSQINSDMATFSIVTSVDWGTNFALSYNVVTPRFDTATKIQALLCGTNDTEVANMNITRSYIGNNSNLIFSTNTPYISDLDTVPSTYTIGFTVSGSFGKFSFAINEAATTSLTFTGTKAQCDAKFASVYFWPNINVSSNGTFTYTQIKNGVEQVSQTVALQGTAGTYANAREINFLVGQSYTPDISDFLYADFDLLLLGGGGGGSNLNGGGGGEIKVITGLSIPSFTSYTVTIGDGGQGAFGTGAGQTATNGTITSMFGYSALAGSAGASSLGGAGAGTYAGSGGSSGTNSGGIQGGGGGGAGGGGRETSTVQNGGNYNISNGYGGTGGLSNGYIWNGDPYEGGYANGGGGASTGASTVSARTNAGRGASQGNFATSGTSGWGSGGGGGVLSLGRPAGNGGSGRITIRFYSK
jgi:hypothetical protein